MAFRKSVTDRAGQAVICYDPFHVVKLGTEALNTVRRQEWQQMRELDAAAAKTFKGARWALLKNPDDLIDAFGRHPDRDQTHRAPLVAGLPAQVRTPRDPRPRPAH